MWNQKQRLFARAKTVAEPIASMSDAGDVRASYCGDNPCASSAVFLPTNTVQVEIQSAKGALPATLGLRWLHATRAGFDRSQELVQSGHGRYRAVIPELAPGHWYVQVEAQDWRLQGSLQAPGEMRLELKPSRTLVVPAV